MIELKFAEADDDAALRHLLAQIPMPGAISLGFEREPSFFYAAGIEGEFHRTVVIKDGDRAIGLGSRSVRDAWINGEKRRLAYLSQIRIDPAYRARGQLLRAFAKMRELQEADGTYLHVTTIISDNAPARRILERDVPGKPHYQQWTELSTLALLVRSWPKLGQRRERQDIRWAGPGDLDGIVQCLGESNQRFQFAPVWTRDDLIHPERCRSLRPEDFVVACRGTKIVACLALWDQRSFKQTVIRGYTGPLSALRPVYNGLAPLLGFPRLPSPGEEVPFAYISHFAIPSDDLAEGMIRLAVERVRGTGIAYLALGLAAEHPLLPVIRRAFRHLEYRSVVYVVYFPDTAEAAAQLDRRPVHLELAVL